MSDTITLYEYERTSHRLSESQSRRLASVGRGAITVEPEAQHGYYSITAQNMVGTLVVDDLRVLIRPKIRPENLFLLLEVGLDPDAWRQEAFDYETSANLLPSVIAFYARTLETTLARGLLRSYRHTEERLVALRGRIDMAGQFRQAGIRVPVACRFDEYSSDIAENRYLKAATRLALRVPGVAPEDRQRLLREVVSLEDVADVHIQPGELDRIAFTRLNTHYQPALRLAQLLLANLTLADQLGKRAASSFLVDMNKLFEDFVTQRLRRELRGRLEVLSQFGTHLAERRQVPIRPDLVFRRQGVEVLVADIKYKLTGDAQARTSDYYQLLAYTTALDLPEGLLIYCLADGGRPEGVVTVRHAGKRLHTLAIDLTGPPSAVAAELSSLSEWINGRARIAA
ncbi:McrC family protein [Candidatus Poriferisocius sp.]|uniref:McrC family protein n=1 Tax=Candidatus Poriferisocius sp. TaxID=3101276 RepID=UPI003B02455A